MQKVEMRRFPNEFVCSWGVTAYWRHSLTFCPVARSGGL